MIWLKLGRAFAVAAVMAFVIWIVSACFLDFEDTSNTPTAKQITAVSLGVFAVMLVASAACAAVHRGGIPGWVWRRKQGELKRSRHPVLYWLAVLALVMLLIAAVWLAVQFIIHGESLGT